VYHERRHRFTQKGLFLVKLAAHEALAESPRNGRGEAGRRDSLLSSFIA
jgi:hypothetical protein